MKLIALHDDVGKIVAAARLTDNYKGPVPVAGKGTSVVKVDVPEAHAKLDIATICARLRIDTRTYKLVEHKAEPAR